MAYRAQKLTDQYKCPFMMELKEHLNNNDLEMEDRDMVHEAIKYLDRNGGGKGTCGMKKGGMRGNDVPTIWRKHMGNIVMGSFCEMDGEWYWSKVASCGCKSCGREYEDMGRGKKWKGKGKDMKKKGRKGIN